MLNYHKSNTDDHPKLKFNKNKVQQCLSQKHLGLILDNKTDFNKDLDEKINKRKNKTIKMMKKLSLLVPRQVYWPFINHLSDKTCGSCEYHL